MLTVVRQSPTEIAREAAELLFKKIAGLSEGSHREMQASKILFRAQLILRRSCGSPRNGIGSSVAVLPLRLCLANDLHILLRRDLGNDLRLAICEWPLDLPSRRPLRERMRPQPGNSVAADRETPPVGISGGGGKRGLQSSEILCPSYRAAREHLHDIRASLPCGNYFGWRQESAPLESPQRCSGGKARLSSG